MLEAPGMTYFNGPFICFFVSSKKDRPLKQILGFDIRRLVFNTRGYHISVYVYTISRYTYNPSELLQSLYSN